MRWIGRDGAEGIATYKNGMQIRLAQSPTKEDVVQRERRTVTTERTMNEW